MYILVNKDDIQVASIRDAYHETMPDGRVILSGSELKMAGSIANCQIVATARQLRDLADRQREELSAGGGTDVGTDLPGGEEQPVDTPVTPGTDVDSDGSGLTGEDTDENEEVPGSSPSDDTDDTVTEDGEAGQETDITVNTNVEE